jgi:hypothetical protein
VLIRRWNEEIIVTEEGDTGAKRASNRANFLLLKLIRHRYPGLVSNQEDERCIFEWLAIYEHIKISIEIITQVREGTTR